MISYYRDLIRGSLNILLVFFLGGLWHGAGWTFVAWGLMHGIATVIHQIWKQAGLKMNAFLGWTCTFLFVNTTWVFFRAETFDDAIRIIRGMFGLSGILFSHYFTKKLYTVIPAEILNIESVTNKEFMTSVTALIFILIFMTITLLAPNTIQLINFISYREKYLFRVSVKNAVTAGLLAAAGVTTLLISEGSEFLYFNF